METKAKITKNLISLDFSEDGGSAASVITPEKNPAK